MQIVLANSLLTASALTFTFVEDVALSLGYALLILCCPEDTDMLPRLVRRLVAIRVVIHSFLF